MKESNPIPETQPDLESRVQQLEKSVKVMKVMRNISFAIIILGIAGYSVSTLVNNARKAI